MFRLPPRRAKLALQGARVNNQLAHRYQDRHSCGATPGGNAQFASEINAILNVVTVTPHSEKFRMQQIAERRRPCLRVGHDNEYDFRRSRGHIVRQCYLHLAIKRDVRCQTDCFEHSILLDFDYTWLLYHAIVYDFGNAKRMIHEPFAHSQTIQIDNGKTKAMRSSADICRTFSEEYQCPDADKPKPIQSPPWKTYSTRAASNLSALNRAIRTASRGARPCPRAILRALPNAV